MREEIAAAIAQPPMIRIVSPRPTGTELGISACPWPSVTNNSRRPIEVTNRPVRPIAKQGTIAASRTRNPDPPSSTPAGYYTRPRLLGSGLLDLYLSDHAGFGVPGLRTPEEVGAGLARRRGRE